ncbi:MULTISPECIES: hypothetical protein [unclassified Streptomyces]|uniref:hypothetical protein n=1 Tax=unclassified Streptomyces TaxID=2593676 RepID=UPI0021524A97|nr:hypothetical protein [Streptomyces sp. CB02959]
MDFTLTPAEEAVVRHVAACLRAGAPPADDDVAEALGDEVRPLLQSLLDKGWLVVGEDRALTLSTIARAVLADRGDASDPRR